MRTSMENLVDQVFTSSSQPDPDWLRGFLGSLEGSWKEAAKAENHALIGIASAWMVATAVGAGFISEAGVGSFKMDNIKQLLVVAPVAIGFFAYRYFLFASVRKLLDRSVSRLYSHVLPSVHAAGLDDFLSTSTLLGAELALQPADDYKLEQSIRRFWLRFIEGGAALGSLFAITHALYVLWVAEQPALWLIGISAIASILLWVRGFLVAVGIADLL
jgi:hypothetical protein